MQINGIHQRPVDIEDYRLDHASPLFRTDAKTPANLPVFH